MKANIISHKTILTIVCTECNKTYKLETKTSDWTNYQLRDELIQNCIPYLRAGERELIMYGILV